MQVAVIGVVDEVVLADLAAKGAELVNDSIPDGAPMVLFRIEWPAALSQLAAMSTRIARDGAIWVVHPRGVPAVADAVIFAAAKEAGLTYTKVVRFSDTDTAEKLVIPRAAR
jgi:hypothetical protein